MSVDDVVEALVAMEDLQQRERVQNGDFSQLGELDLSDEERRLLQGAAAENAEVEGFNFEASNQMLLFRHVSLHQDQLSPHVAIKFGNFVNAAWGGQYAYQCQYRAGQFETFS